MTTTDWIRSLVIDIVMNLDKVAKLRNYEKKIDENGRNISDLREHLFRRLDEIEKSIQAKINKIVTKEDCFGFCFDIDA